MNFEKKIEEFEQSCFSLASSDIEKLKNEIEKEIEIQIKTEMEEYLQRKEWNYNKTMEQLEKNYMKEVFKIQNDCKKEILLAKKEIYKSLKNDVIKRIEDFSNTLEYEKFLLNSIKQSIAVTNDNANIILGITSKDLSKYKSQIEELGNFKLEIIEDKYIGGCIVKTDTIIIDNTLLYNIEEKMID